MYNPPLFHSKGDQTLKQVIQSSCGISTLGDN